MNDKSILTEVDARGLPCPQPVFATKRALESILAGAVLVRVDNEIAKENICKFARASNFAVNIESAEGGFKIIVHKGKVEPQQAVVVATPPMADEMEKLVKEKLVDKSRDQFATAYLITQEILGLGMRQLGEILIKSMFFTLAERDVPPALIVFMNSAVNLTTQESPIIGHLRRLAENGCRILACGTCLEYYNIKDRLAVGEITNMYSALEELEQFNVITI